jgi:hypothetical protein
MRQEVVRCFVAKPTAVRCEATRADIDPQQIGHHITGIEKRRPRASMPYLK